MSALYRIPQQKQKQALRLLARLTLRTNALFSKALRSNKLNLNLQFICGEHPNIILRLECTSKIDYLQHRRTQEIRRYNQRFSLTSTIYHSLSAMFNFNWWRDVVALAPPAVPDVKLTFIKIKFVLSGEFTK